MNSKLSVGGLMQAEYLASCLVIKNRQMIEDDDLSFAVLLAQSAREKVLYDGHTTSQDTRLSDDQIKLLPDIIQFWRIQQLWERLLNKTDQRLDSIAPQYLARLLEQSGVTSLNELIEKKEKYAKIVDQAMTDFFAPFAMTESEIEDWLETGVNWLS